MPIIFVKTVRVHIAPKMYFFCTEQETVQYKQEVPREHPPSPTINFLTGSIVLLLLTKEN